MNLFLSLYLARTQTIYVCLVSNTARSTHTSSYISLDTRISEENIVVDRLTKQD